LVLKYVPPLPPGLGEWCGGIRNTKKKSKRGSRESPPGIYKERERRGGPEVPPLGIYKREREREIITCSSALGSPLHQRPRKAGWSLVPVLTNRVIECYKGG